MEQNTSYQPRVEKGKTTDLHQLMTFGVAALHVILLLFWFLPLLKFGLNLGTFGLGFLVNTGLGKHLTTTGSLFQLNPILTILALVLWGFGAFLLFQHLKKASRPSYLYPVLTLFALLIPLYFLLVGTSSAGFIKALMRTSVADPAMVKSDFNEMKQALFVKTNAWTWIGILLSILQVAILAFIQSPTLQKYLRRS